MWSPVLTDRTELLVSVFEEGVADTAPRLSISNVPLSAALHLVLRWPQERREGVSIEMPGRVVPWARINELYGTLYQPPMPERGSSGHWHS
jgi:hypothetical protein